MLGDLTMEFDLGGVVLTSISSYTDRDILVVRDASQLTGSITFDFTGGASIRPPRDPHEFGAARRDRRSRCSRRNCASPRTTDGRFQWVLGGFYSDIERDYSQTLPTPGYDSTLPT